MSSGPSESQIGGNRSGSAHRQLQQFGYERVFNVAGGMNAWSSAGLPVAR